MSTIVAAATAHGTGALAVVRLSGRDAWSIAGRVAVPMTDRPLVPNRMRRVRICDASGEFDDGMLWIGKGPRSVTGEDTAEITCHGNPLIVRRIVEACIAAGARVAEAGEFTRRALEHGRLDRVSAEAVLHASLATSDEGLRIARDEANGTLAEWFGDQRQRLVEVAADLEARLDWPDDELAYQTDDALIRTLSGVAEHCRALAATQARGRMFVEGARVALVGTVNAGKSSLFNALVGRNRALVHPTPGTTRDVLEIALDLDGLRVTLMDTAGERDTDDPIEAAGLALARELLQEADLLVVVSRGAVYPGKADRPVVRVWNGIDEHPQVPDGMIGTCALDGRGVDQLRTAIRDALVGETVGEGRAIASLRQRDRLIAVADACEEAIHAIPGAGVAVAAEAVARGIAEIDAVFGGDGKEDVLSALFQRFCIGK